MAYMKDSTGRRLDDVALPTTREVAAAVVPPRKAPITWIQTFQSGHGWSGSGGSGKASVDFASTSAGYLGTLGVRMVTTGLGGSGCYIEKLNLTAIDLTGKSLVVAVRHSDVTKYAGFNVYAGSGGSFTANYLWSIASDSPRPPIVTSGDWCLLTLSFADAVVTGSPTRNAINALRIVTIDNAGGAVTFDVGGYGTIPEPATFPNGLVSFCFDDTFLAHHDVALPALAKNSFRGTLFPIVSRIDVGGYMTSAQVSKMHDLGWEVGAHATTDTTHAGLLAMTEPQRLAELEALRTWLLTNGYEADSYAYPNGSYDGPLALDVRKYFASARGVNATTREVWPPTARDRLRLKNAGIGAFANLAALQAEVDKAKTNKSWLIFLIHNIVSSGASGNDMATATFTGLVDYVAAQGLSVLPVREAIKYAA